MRIEAVDLFYLSMPEITEEADGSQDALLVRVGAGGRFGFGECEAAPLPSIAAFVCPMSHGVCRPVGASVLGAPLEGPEDIARIAARDGASFLTFHTRPGSLPASTLTNAPCGAVLGHTVSSVTAANLTSPIFPDLTRSHRCNLSAALGTSWNDLTNIATSLCSGLSGISRIYYTRTFTNGAQTAVSRGEVWQC